MDKLKKIKFNLKYLTWAAWLAFVILLIWLGSILAYRYAQLFKLSGSINQYRSNVMVEKIDEAKAKAVIDYLSGANYQPIDPSTLINPFKIIKEETPPESGESENTATSTEQSTETLPESE